MVENRNNTDGKAGCVAFEPDCLLGGESCGQWLRLDMPADGPVAPILFSSPHSGRCYPRDFVAEAALELEELRASEDFAVDLLFADAPSLGMPLLTAQRPRAWLDLNRAPHELSAEMFDGPPPPWADTASERARGGLGVIPRFVTEEREIYARKLGWEEARQRIEQAWNPYHRALDHQLRALAGRFGAAVLIDCHSMPESAARAMTPLSLRQPDIILGDVDGTSCDGRLTDVLEQLFMRAGLNVRRNRVYTGGYITRQYGLRGLGFHAVQIEINRRLYVRPGQYELTEAFFALRDIIRGVIAELPDRLAPLWRQALPQAAE